MQITGRVYVKVDGDLLRSKQGAKLMYGGVRREAVIGNQVDGFTEEAVAPEVECTISHAADTSLAKLAAIKDATLTFETDTGKTFVLRGAFLTDPPELTGGQGEVPLKFSAISCEEV
ncbi:MAG TPA: phage tail tube protein [Methylomirabilota bacterium]|nr:phage tail tube protein [Methylomirabilota bacterium]